MTTTLASITAFYYGSRLATQAHRDAAAAAAAGATRAGPSEIRRPGLAVTIATPSEGAVYNQNDHVIADYTCTPSEGAQIMTGTGTVPSGTPIDTSQPGQKTFTVEAADSAGQTSQVTRAYTVEAHSPPTDESTAAAETIGGSTGEEGTGAAADSG